jgi:hypothetical protein
VGSGEGSLLLNAFAFSHGDLAFDENGVGIMADTVGNGISQGGFADFVIPAADLKLRAKDGGGFL